MEGEDEEVRSIACNSVLLIKYTCRNSIFLEEISGVHIWDRNKYGNPKGATCWGSVQRDSKVGCMFVIETVWH